MLLTPDIEAAFNSRFSALISVTGDWPVAVSVSGGGDSTALLVLAAKWQHAANRRIVAVSVDHGLRPEAAAELAQVTARAKTFDVPHSVLTWRGWDGQGNLQDKARDARRRLIRDWAQAQGVAAIATGHSRDDQAETFLMRLARGSGVDGLAAMYSQENFDGLRWIRPLLEMSRQSLRTYLQEQNIPWSEDPSNEDLRFDRVRFRQAAEALAELGLDAETLANTANRMKNARYALESATQALACAAAEPTDIGTVKLDRTRLAAAPIEIRQRLLAHALGWVSQQPYRPRLEALQQGLAAIEAGKNFTLHGCLIAVGKTATVEVCREAAAVAGQPASTGLFDNRWQVQIAEPPKGATLRALGEDGLRALPDWRDSGYSRWALSGSPSLWQKDELIAAPFVVTSGTCVVQLVADNQNFFTSIMTH